MMGVFYLAQKEKLIMVAKYFNISNSIKKKGSDKMLELEENQKELELLKTKLESLGESL